MNAKVEAQDSIVVYPWTLWRASVAREPWRSLPRSLHVFVGVSVALTAIAIGLAAPLMRVPQAALVAVACVVGAAVFPIVRNPAGGTMHFVSTVWGAAAILYDPATTFMGIVVGWGLGNTLLHRRPWVAGPMNGLYHALPAAGAAALLAYLRASWPPAAVTALTALVVVLVMRPAYVTYITLYAWSRWKVPPWRYWVNRMTTDIGVQAMDVLWLTPIVAGAAIVPPPWTWVVLAGSVPLCGLDAVFGTAPYRIRATGRSVLADTPVPTHDPRLQAIAAQLNQGAALVDLDGTIVAITPLAMQLLGVHTVAAGTRLDALCPRETRERVNGLVRAARQGGQSGRLTVPISGSGSAAPRWLTLAATNRLDDPAVRSLVVTLSGLSDEQQPWRVLSHYADRAFALPLVQALEDERRMVATQFDSTLRQTLALMQLGLDRPQLSSELAPRDLLRRALEAARILQRAIAPPELDDLGLIAALHSYTEDLGRSGLTVTVVGITEDVSLPIPRDVALVAYRTIQWIVDNIVRRAGDTTATIRLSISDNHLRILIPEDGVPLAAKAVLGMIEGVAQIEGRLSLVDGKVQVQPVRGRGARVVVDLPMDPS